MAAEIVAIWNRTKIPQKSQQAIAVDLGRYLTKFKNMKPKDRNKVNYQ